MIVDSCGDHALQRRWHRWQGPAADAALRLHLHLALAQPAQACPYGTGCWCIGAVSGAVFGAPSAWVFPSLRRGNMTYHTALCLFVVCWKQEIGDALLSREWAAFGNPNAVASGECAGPDLVQVFKPGYLRSPGTVDGRVSVPEPRTYALPSPVAGLKPLRQPLCTRIRSRTWSSLCALIAWN